MTDGTLGRPLSQTTERRRCKAKTEMRGFFPLYVCGPSFSHTLSLTLSHSLSLTHSLSLSLSLSQTLLILLILPPPSISWNKGPERSRYTSRPLYTSSITTYLPPLSSTSRRGSSIIQQGILSATECTLREIMIQEG